MTWLTARKSTAKRYLPGSFLAKKKDGLPYRHWEVFRPFKAILVSLEIDPELYHLKELRHTTGSIMNLKGSDPMAIKDQLRHTDFKTTQDFYIGSDLEYQREQAEKISLNLTEARA